MPTLSSNRTNRINSSKSARKSHLMLRISFINVFLIIIGAIFIVRAFQLQVIKHAYYQQAADKDQLKAYVLPAQRGMIEASSGGQIVPIVLNQTLYTLFADPAEIQNAKHDAVMIQNVIGGNANTYTSEMNTTGTEYVVMATKLSQSQANAVNKLNITGVATQSANYRVYPDGSLAEPLLGFVNANGIGQYGIEQALNNTLSGTDGQVKAITDSQGVPLIGNKNNVIKQPVNGNNVVLTVNLPVQEQLETILPTMLKKVNSSSGSVTILNVNNGNVVAMADYPSYDPSNYSIVSNPQVYQNSAVDDPIEPGSVMKTLTVSAALDTNSIFGPNETFNDPGSWQIDGSSITDIAQDGGVDKGNISVASILVNSLNTGATWLLMQMGGGQINAHARTAWYNYMVNHFHLGSATGIQQGYEAAGFVPSPTSGYALDLTYANTAFGQGITTTPLQLAAADAAILNGGTYYVPNLVQSVVNSTTGKQTNVTPTIWKKNIVSSATSKNLETIMEDVTNSNWWFYQMTQPQAGYIIGGKTGTAQIALPTGGYSTTDYNGTFVGFVGVNNPQYVIVVEVNDPHIPENSIDTYAGAGAAAPIFGKVINMLINGGYVTNN